MFIPYAMKSHDLYERVSLTSASNTGTASLLFCHLLLHCATVHHPAARFHTEGFLLVFLRQ